MRHGGRPYRDVFSSQGPLFLPVVWAADLLGARLAVNSPYSHSGTTAVLPLVAPLGRGGTFFSEVLVSGSHAASLGMIEAGRADAASIDCVTWALLARLRPEALAGARILVETPAAPGPPYVAPVHHGEVTLSRMRTALQETFANLRAKAMLLAKKNDPKSAVAYGEKALAVAKTAQPAPNATQVKELEELVAGWKKGT